MAMHKWIVPGIFKADVEKVNDEIADLGETTTPGDLVSFAAGNPDSELYKCFEWDDGIAAEKYRLEQARKVLQSIVIVTEEPDVPAVREYSLVTKEDTSRAYMPTRLFLRDEEAYDNLLKQALADLKAFEKKYHALTELDAVFAAIDEL